MYSFQPDYPGEACLKTDFSYMDENEVVTLTITSAVCGDSELKAFLPPAKYYSYVASTFDCGCGGQFQQSVIIEGTGTTGDYDFGKCAIALCIKHTVHTGVRLYLYAHSHTTLTHSLTHSVTLSCIHATTK